MTSRETSHTRLADKIVGALFGPHSPRKRTAANEEEVLRTLAIIERHEPFDERQRICDANKLIPSFQDNVRVKSGRNGAEFFAISLAPPEPDLPYEVQIKRYCVPGRCWVYGFEWHEGRGMGQGDRVVYGSEGTTSLPDALKLVAQDLDRPQVVALFKEAFAASRILSLYIRDTESLLRAIAPRSKSYRLVAKLSRDLDAWRKAEFERRRAERIAAQ